MKEKNVNLDVIRILAIFLFVAILISNAYCYNYKGIALSEYSFALSINLISRIGFAYFFMTMGAILLPKQETIKNCLKRTLRYFIILLLWTTIYYLFITYYLKGKVVLDTLLKNPIDSNLWVFYVMIPIFLTMPFFQILCKHMTRGHEIALIVISTAAVVGLFYKIGADYEFALLGRHSYGAFYMLLGYLIQKYKDDIPLKNWHLLIIFVVSNALNIWWALYNATLIDAHYVKAIASHQPFNIINSAVLFLVLIRLKIPAKKWISTFASCSCGIFLLTILGYAFVRNQLKITTFPAYWFIPLFTVVMVAISYGITYLIRKIPGGKFIF